MRDQIESRLRDNPIVLLVGPRQCGKTTLARQFAAAHDASYFDLESPKVFVRDTGLLHELLGIADVPKVTRSLTVAHQDLKLDHVFIVYPGPETFTLTEWATALSIKELKRRLTELKG